MLRAERVQEKASKVGFDWNKKSDVWKKVEEEIRELKEAEEGSERSLVEEEYGDLLFALVNYGRFLAVNPEIALRHAVDKFLMRFRAMESGLKQRGKDVHDATLEEMDLLWNEAKLR